MSVYKKVIIGLQGTAITLVPRDNVDDISHTDGFATMKSQMGPSTCTLSIEEFAQGRVTYAGRNVQKNRANAALALAPNLGRSLLQ